ncbi:hypothetical protein Hanom_Chr11g01011631 [Helianthus anomalus]
MVKMVYEVDRRRRQKLELGFQPVTTSHSRSGFKMITRRHAMTTQLWFRRKHNHRGEYGCSSATLEANPAKPDTYSNERG